MERGDIYLVSLDPTSGHEQQGNRPVLVVSPVAFNRLTKTPVVVPITSGRELRPHSRFAVSLMGAGNGTTTGVVRCDQPRALDLAHAMLVSWKRAASIMDEVLAKLATLFE